MSVRTREIRFLVPAVIDGKHFREGDTARIHQSTAFRMILNEEAIDLDGTPSPVLKEMRECRDMLTGYRDGQRVEVRMPRTKPQQ
jgi:hypothetical protein